MNKPQNKHKIKGTYAAPKIGRKQLGTLLKVDRNFGIMSSLLAWEHSAVS